MKEISRKESMENELLRDYFHPKHQSTLAKKRHAQQENQATPPTHSLSLSLLFLIRKKLIRLINWILNWTEKQTLTDIE